MRVALVLNEIPTGSETFLIDKVLGLIDRGVDVQVLCSRVRLDAWDLHPDLADRRDVLDRVHPWPDRGLPAHALTVIRLGAGAHRGHRRRRMRSLLTSVAKRRTGTGLAITLLGLDPDVVHFEFGWLARDLAPAAAGVGLVCTASFRGADLNYVGLHDPGYYDELWPALAAVHCLGTDLWDRALRRGCPPGMPHALIPPAVDVQRFRPPLGRPSLTGRPLRIVTVSRLHWKKGLEHGLDAVRRTLDAGVDVSYRVIGAGPHEPAVRACIADLQLDGHVTLLGHQHRRVIRDELATADVLLHPAVSEGFANAVLEAQAMEVPVVTTDADGLGDNVEDGVTGWVVPRRDADALARALCQVAEDPDRAREMGRAGRVRVAELFRPADQIDAFVGFYRRVITPTAVTGPTTG